MLSAANTWNFRPNRILSSASHCRVSDAGATIRQRRDPPARRRITSKIMPASIVFVQHTIVELLLPAIRLNERLGERRRQTLPPRPARPLGAYGAGQANRVGRVPDPGRQFEARGQIRGEFARVAIVPQILPALGRTTDEDLEEHVERQRPRDVVGSKVLRGAIPIEHAHHLGERRLRDVVGLHDREQDAPDFMVQVVDPKRVHPRKVRVGKGAEAMLLKLARELVGGLLRETTDLERRTES